MLVAHRGRARGLSLPSRRSSGTVSLGSCCLAWKPALSWRLFVRRALAWSAAVLTKLRDPSHRAMWLAWCIERSLQPGATGSVAGHLVRQSDVLRPVDVCFRELSDAQFPDLGVWRVGGSELHANARVGVRSQAAFQSYELASGAGVGLLCVAAVKARVALEAEVLDEGCRRPSDVPSAQPRVPGRAQRAKATRTCWPRSSRHASATRSPATADECSVPNTA